MNKGLTVAELAYACNIAIANGHGDKHILITTDDEGNGYHTLFYAFQDDPKDIKYALEIEHDNHNADEVILLG